MVSSDAIALLGKRPKDHLIRWAMSVAIGSPDECWEWVGSVNKETGYGNFRYDKQLYPHRFACEMFNGPIPEGFEVDHLCKNRKCVNPRHLEAVHRTVNNLRSDSVAGKHARQTHCLRGHEFTKSNTAICRQVKKTLLMRICRACRKINWHKRGGRVSQTYYRMCRSMKRIAGKYGLVS